MKKIMHFRQFIVLIFSLSFLCFTTNALSKNITLYDQPQSDSKVIGNIDSHIGLITIFTPKEGKWIKVADPRNGNVGWIKSTDLGQIGFSVNIISTGENPHSYQFIQYGNVKSYNSEEVNKYIKQITLRQKAIQKDMQLMMEDMYADMNFPFRPFPMVMPVFVLPEKINHNNVNDPSAKKEVKK